ncbi:hypothetical protein K227x_04950 [Rubripirellula lacrimiformis]|uniref:BON domain-containing protein n=1 Tax=Rubripirellula lacrimiformis TaxID=1930273 RepID=A0A517N4Q9_9BACT|nr:BON domain-containing protein [Rubripirellula lacrimiformis]QDT02124.1 hypothetical protein K227x_04950 [Rubripirellula lacrimiformis]
MTQTPSSRAEHLVPVSVGRTQPDSLDEKSQAVEAQIRRVGRRGLADVHAKAMDGWIVLQGRVPSYYLKQIAQESVRPLAIGMQIRNQIRVCQ